MHSGYKEKKKSRKKGTREHQNLDVMNQFKVENGKKMEKKESI